MQLAIAKTPAAAAWNKQDLLYMDTGNRYYRITGTADVVGRSGGWTSLDGAIDAVAKLTKGRPAAAGIFQRDGRFYARELHEFSEANDIEPAVYDGKFHIEKSDDFAPDYLSFDQFDVENHALKAVVDGARVLRTKTYEGKTDV